MFTKHTTSLLETIRTSYVPSMLDLYQKILPWMTELEQRLSSLEQRATMEPATKDVPSDVPAPASTTRTTSVLSRLLGALTEEERSVVEPNFSFVGALEVFSWALETAVQPVETTATTAPETSTSPKRDSNSSAGTSPSDDVTSFSKWHLEPNAWHPDQIQLVDPHGTYWANHKDTPENRKQLARQADLLNMQLQQFEKQQKSHIK